MRKLFCLSMLVTMVAAVLAAPKGEFWEDKEFTKWSQKEVNKLLTDSPWAKELRLSNVGIMDNSKSSTDGQQPYISYRVQFRSALPIRQAIVRQQQLMAKYDSLPQDQKEKMDKSADSFLNGFPEEAVVVTVSYDTNDNVRIQELARHWQSRTTDLLKTLVYLSSSKGDKVPVARYQPGEGADHSFTFIFPREYNGKPVVTPQDKNLKLEFAYPAMGMGSGQAYMEFKVEKMIFNGNIAY